MNENQLVSLDDAALDEVNGGLSFNAGIEGGPSVSLSASFKNGVSAAVKLFGETFKLTFSLFG